MEEEGKDAMGLLFLMIGLSECCNGPWCWGRWFTGLPPYVMVLEKPGWVGNRHKIYIYGYDSFLKTKGWFCILIAGRKGARWPGSKLTFNWKRGWCRVGVRWQNDKCPSKREMLDAISCHKLKSWYFNTILTVALPWNRTHKSRLISLWSIIHKAAIFHFEKVIMSSMGSFGG